MGRGYLVSISEAVIAALKSRSINPQLSFFIKYGQSRLLRVSFIEL